MGLDKDDSTPPVDVKKRTTKVNIWMVIAILVFFAVAGAMVWFTRGHPPTHADNSPAPAPSPAGK